MIWWLALFTLSAFAEDTSVEKYCYGTVAEMKSNHARSKMIFVPSDQVAEDENCLVIQMRPHRRELIQTYLKQLSPNVSVSFSSAELRRDPCKLKVEKIRESHQERVSGSINQAQTTINADTLKESGKDTMQITTLNEFELMVNQESIRGECRFITPIRYEISLEVKKEPRQTSRLVTTLQLNQGEKIEIGGLVKSLKEKSGSLDTRPSAAAETTDGANTERVFLSLD